MTFDDLINLINSDNLDILVIAHNCFNSYRKGIPSQLVERYPQIAQADMDSTTTPNNKKLGHYSVARIENTNNKSVLILNAYVQYFYGKVDVVCQSRGSSLKDRSPVQYEAIYNVFKLIAQKFNNQRIYILGFPGVRVDVAKVLIEAALKDSKNTINYINFDDKKLITKE